MIATDWPQIVAAVIGYMALKATGIYVVARLTSSSHAEALTRAALLAQGGEFAFVLFAAAASVGVFDARTQAIMTATVIISMALTPLLVMSLKWILPRQEESLDGVDPVDKLNGRVLVVGFGRFGQIASQSLLLRGVDVSIIDNDIEMIKAAATFGFKVYYGDGTRLDILHAAGAGRAEGGTGLRRQGRRRRDESPVTSRPNSRWCRCLPAPMTARYSMQLVRAGVDYQIRETFKSAIKFGEDVLVGLGVSPRRPPRRSRKCAGATRAPRAADRRRYPRRQRLVQGQHAGADAAAAAAPERPRVERRDGRRVGGAVGEPLSAAAVSSFNARPFWRDCSSGVGNGKLPLSKPMQSWISPAISRSRRSRSRQNTP